jgi:hypothetical protein
MPFPALLSAAFWCDHGCIAEPNKNCISGNNLLNPKSQELQTMDREQSNVSQFGIIYGQMSFQVQKLLSCENYLNNQTSLHEILCWILSCENYYQKFLAPTPKRKRKDKIILQFFDTLLLNVNLSYVQRN